MAILVPPSSRAARRLTSATAATGRIQCATDVRQYRAASRRPSPIVTNAGVRSNAILGTGESGIHLA